MKKPRRGDILIDKICRLHIKKPRRGDILIDKICRLHMKKPHRGDINEINTKWQTPIPKFIYTLCFP
jgi:hypothetical protein